MILSNREIQQAIDEKRLIIDPEPTPRDPSADDSPYNTSAVDLRLGKTISIPEGGSFAYDLRKGGLKNFLAKHVRHINLEDVGGFPMEPGQFALGMTLEFIGLPIVHGLPPSLAARVEGKSSFGRCGLLVHFTAPTVHAGWEGPLTLELKNLGVNAINLYYKMPICQLILEQVLGEPILNPSQFHRQEAPEGTKKIDS